MLAALGAYELLAGGHGEGGWKIVPVGTAVVCQTGVHKTQAVKKFGAGAEGGADAGHAGPLVQGEGGGHVEDFIDIGLRGLGHAAARVGRERLEVTSRALGVKHTQRQRGFAGAGHPRHGHDFVQRHVYIDVFEVVHARAPDADMRGARFIVA